MLFNMTSIEYEPMTIKLSNGMIIEPNVPKIGFIKRFLKALSAKSDTKVGHEIKLCMLELLRDTRQEKRFSPKLVLKDMSDKDISKLAEGVVVWIMKISKNPMLALPRLSEDDAGARKSIECRTGFEKLVCDYTGLNMLQTDDLRLTEYLAYLRDAYIYSLMQTEKGREQLEDAWYLEQEEMDTEGVKKISGGMALWQEK